MVRCSNAVVCFANFVTILVAVPLIACGLWMKTEAHGQCQRSIQWIIIIIGAALLVLALCGIFGSCCRLNFFLWIYLFFMFLLILCTILSMAFSFAVTSKKIEENISDTQFMNISSNWLKTWATKDWDLTEKCMKEAELCDTRVMKLLTKKNDTIAGHIIKDTELYKELSPIQLGCCKPPSDCGFTYVDDTHWDAPKSMANVTNGDCKAWSKEGLCYSCDSCKVGMIKSARRNIRIIGWANMAVLVILVIVYSMGCCAFRNNQGHKYERSH